MNISQVVYGQDWQISTFQPLTSIFAIYLMNSLLPRSFSLGISITIALVITAVTIDAMIDRGVRAC